MSLNELFKKFKMFIVKKEIYHILLTSGYNVSVGKNNTEIDFVGVQENEKIYIQVLNTISDTKTRMEKFNLLNNIKDDFPKLMITLDGTREKKEGNVIIINFTDWFYHN